MFRVNWERRRKRRRPASSFPKRRITRSAAAIGPKTGLVLKVHTSNYRIDGFTAEVSARSLAALVRERGVPLVYDLGSGTLVDLTR
jgi:seryl-tRNA(Sec) selenium transferase